MPPQLPEHLERAILAAWPTLTAAQQRLWWQVLIVLLPADCALLDALQAIILPTGPPDPPE